MVAFDNFRPSLHRLARRIARLTVLERQLVGTSDLFDPDWYRTFYPDVASSGLDPLSHYLRVGATANRNPSLAFDAGFYLSQYPDVADSGMGALLHYLRFGLAEGRRYRSMDHHRACQLITDSGFFDATWYMSRYPDVEAARIDPLEHFLDCASAELRDPGPDFSTAYYLTFNQEVAASGVNPVVHYVTRPPESNFRVRGGAWQHQRKLLLTSGLFDPHWYLKTYPDVAQNGADPLDHYLEYGGTELRSPGPGFDAAAYASRNPDVAANGLNPLLHCLESGTPSSRLGSRFDTLGPGWSWPPPTPGLPDAVVDCLGT